jgi:flagellar biosynthesis GTPase FlhF
MKSEYEYKITMMQKRIAELEKENDDSREALMVCLPPISFDRYVELTSMSCDRPSRQKLLVRGISSLKFETIETCVHTYLSARHVLTQCTPQRYADQSSTLQRLRTDHEALQTSSRSLTQSSADSSRLRSDLDRITNERAEAEELANELRDEVGSLVDELRSVNARYEEVMEDRDRDAREIREIEEESRGWRKKYEAAKVELRNVKGESHSFFDARWD